MWNTYCKKNILTLVQWKGGSQVWEIMLENREVIQKKTCGGRLKEEYGVFGMTI